MQVNIFLLFTKLILAIYLTRTTVAIKFYWNIPTFMCRNYGIYFTNLSAEYGVYQNQNDSFRGDQISILYDPGNFPALLENSTSKQLVRRNGGVPQEGSLIEHLKVFSKHLDELIPDPTNGGIAVIDFESWRPVFRQNFGALQPYKDLSFKIEREKHWHWSKKDIEKEARKRFEIAGKKFMEETIILAKRVRPNAQWGYYAFPYCFNGRGNNPENCAANVEEENNKLNWLFDSSDAIYPSVYMQEAMNPNLRIRMVKGRVREAVRVASRTSGRLKPAVYTYIRYVYTDSLKFLTETDMFEAMRAMIQEGSNGIILWGSSNDLNTKAKCLQFNEYLKFTLGPILHSLTLPKYYIQEIS